LTFPNKNQLFQAINLTMFELVFKNWDLKMLVDHLDGWMDG
jgi:hypothetical protein